MKTPWVFLIAFALVFYGNGAGVMDSFVFYPSMRLIGQTEFVAFHRFASPRVLMFLVAPALLGTVFTLLMLWFRPPAIPLWSVWLALALQAVIWISSATIQVPIQLQLGAEGLSLPLIERLIKTNLWLRRIPYATCAGVFLWMAARTLRNSGGAKQGAA